MEFLIDQLKFLGLNDKEVRVFTALSTFGRMNMTKIAKRAGLARTTVDAIVRRLVEQGLIEQEQVGGHQEYTVAPQKVADKLDWIEQRFRPGVCDVPIGKVDTIIHNNATESTTESHSTVYDMLADAFMAHEGERVTILMATLITPEKRMKRFEHCLDHARKAEAKLEMLTTTDVSKGLSQYAKELLASLMAYDLRLNFLPPSFCIESTDLIAFRDSVIVVDHRTDTTERIQGERSIAIINHLLRVAREAGWGMDMKMWLEGVLRSQEKGNKAG